jgi:predicted RNase H-like nuclease (RuvC/YqgF family)
LFSEKSNRKKERTALQTQISQLQTQVSQLTDSLSASERRCYDINHDMAQVKSSNSALRSKHDEEVTSKNAEIEALKEQLLRSAAESGLFVELQKFLVSFHLHFSFLLFSGKCQSELTAVQQSLSAASASNSELQSQIQVQI